MRIIRGTRRGKKLNPPQGLPVRPTTDMAKESLFNIIENYYDLDGISVLDLFSGTGSIAYEFASRGAAAVLSVEVNQKASEYIRLTANQLDFQQLSVIRGDVFHYLKGATRKFDLIFADPPYDLAEGALVPDMVFDRQLLNPDGMLILEHSIAVDYSSHPNFFSERKYGKVHFSFFSAEPQSEEEAEDESLGQ